MRTLDVNNKAHGLALVADDKLTDIKYVPLAELPPDTVPEDGLAFAHLKQAHYVAQHVTFGLTVTRRHPEVSGWLRFDEAAKYWVR